MKQGGSDRVEEMNEALEKYCSPHGKANPETYAYIAGRTVGGDELAKKDLEIERLKGLIEKAHNAGYNDYEKYSISLSWL